MKVLSLFFTIFYSFVVNASIQFPTNYTQVPDDKEDSYRKAIHQAFAANPKAVQACDTNWVYNTVNYAEDILVSKDPTKPLLILNSYYNIDQEVMQRLIITTDASMKSVTQVDAEYYMKEEVNTGDLSNPVFVIDYVLKNRTSCTIKTP